MSTQGKHLTLPVNVRLACRSLPEASTLAYLNISLVAKKKKFCKFASSFGKTSNLTCKYQTRLEKLASSKHSSLFGVFMGGKEKKVL
jgi:hypothetical protein